MIPQSFIQDLLARVDIVEVIERYHPAMLWFDGEYVTQSSSSCSGSSTASP